MLRAAKGEGLAVAIPAARTIELPRADRVESAPPRAMPLDQVQHVLREAPEPLKTVLMLCGACHLRIGEALGLRASDLDLEAGRFTVMRQRSREGITRPKTRASAGERELPVEMIEHLRRYTRINGTGDGFLFRSPRVPGAPVHDTTTRKELNSLLRRLGYKEPRRAFHAFRHAFATLAATRGVSIHVLQKEMGHADRRSTDAYIDVDQTTARAELAEVRSAFFQGLDGRDDDRVVPLRKRNDRKQRKRE
jgi:integrase